MRTIEESLQSFLKIPLKDSSGKIQRDKETGEPLNMMDKILQAVSQKAMKGDIQAVNFLLNIQRNGQKEDEETRKIYAENIEKDFTLLKDQFKKDGLYIGQDTELRMLAEITVMVRKLSAMMQTSDYQPIITEYGRNGMAQTRINPLNKMRDDYAAQFNSQLEKLRDGALVRIFNKKRMKKEKLI